MKTKMFARWLLTSIGAAAFLIPMLGMAQSPSLGNDAQEWVVVLNDPRPARLQGWRAQSYEGGRHYSSSTEFKRFANRVSKQYKLKLKTEWFIESLAVYCLIVEIPGDEERTLDALQKDTRVQWVQPSNNFEALSKPGTESSQSIFKLANHGDASNALPLAVPKWLNGSGVEIAIIDSGVDHTHKDLKGNVARLRDFVSNGPTRQHRVAGETHGTAVAGVIVANPSELGTAGIAPAAKLSAYRGCWEQPSGQTTCSTLSLARALNEVASSRPAILNLSLSGPQDRLLNQLVNKILANKTLIVAAFDPSRPSSARFPQRTNGVLIVRADNIDTKFKDEFTAPGARMVLSPGNRYDFTRGHSIAAAYTSGLLVLLSHAEDQIPGERIDWGALSDASAMVSMLVRRADRLSTDDI